MRFHVLTLFPGIFQGPLSESILSRAIEKGLIEVELHDIRDQADDRHRTVDDYPFGGGAGMVLKPEPLFKAKETVFESASLPMDTPVVLMTPQGRRLDQRIVEDLATKQDLVIVCGRYEGVDERIREHLATDEISIGDYVLGGGELAALVLIEAVSRLVPGVVGSMKSALDDSHTTGLLQHPQYTRPAEFRGWSVPEVLLSGNHAEIERWRRRESLRRTALRRPEMLEGVELTEEDRRFVQGLREDGTKLD